MSNEQDFEIKKIDGGVAVVDYLGSYKSDTVVVPEYIDGEPVIAIGRSAFMLTGNSRKTGTIKEFVLPKTLKIIEEDAFKYSNITSVVIPDGVEEIGGDAFVACYSLENVVLPSSLKIIHECAFQLCKKLKSVELPENLETIKRYAFCACEELTEIHFPKSVERVEASSFTGCPKLEKITGDNDKIKISTSAFSTSVVIKCVDIKLWKSMNFDDVQLENLAVDFVKNLNTYTESEQKEFVTYFKRRKKAKQTAFTQNNSAVVTYLLENGITLKLDEVNACLDENIKKENTEVTAILLDYKNKNFKQEEIEEHDEQLELVEIGLEYPTLKQFKAKWRCGNIAGGLSISGYKGNSEHETIPKQLADGTKILEIKAGYELDYRGIKRLNIEADIVRICSYTFSFSSLEEITLPDTLKYIEINAFLQCKNLKEIRIPKNVRTLERLVFNECKNLEHVYFEDGLQYVESETFYKCTSLKKLVFPPTLVEVAENAIAYCNNLEHLEFQSNVVGALACVNTEVKNVVTSEAEPVAVADELAEEVYNREPLTLKQFKEKWKCSKVDGGLRVSGYKGFNEYEILPKELVDGTKIVMMAYSGDDAFTPIKKLIIEAELIEIGGRTFQYTTTLEEITLPDTLETIGASAFCSTSLKSIKLPEKIKTIPFGAFFGCGKLKEVEIPEGVEEIRSGAFGRCNSLEEIVLPSTLKSLKTGASNGAFTNCKSLKTINIPKGIEVIQSAIFEGCENLENVIAPEKFDNKVKFGDVVFSGCNKLYDENGFMIFNNILFAYNKNQHKKDEIVIPDGMNERIINIPDNVVEIKKGMFIFNDAKEIILPENLEILGENVFVNCYNLERITIPKGVKKIQKNTFENCKKLKEVLVQGKISIHKEAFVECSAVVKEC